MLTQRSHKTSLTEPSPIAIDFFCWSRSIVEISCFDALRRLDSVWTWRWNTFGLRNVGDWDGWTALGVCSRSVWTWRCKTIGFGAGGGKGWTTFSSRSVWTCRWKTIGRYVIGGGGDEWRTGESRSVCVSAFPRGTISCIIGMLTWTDWETWAKISLLAFASITVCVPDSVNGCKKVWIILLETLLIQFSVWHTPSLSVFVNVPTPISFFRGPAKNKCLIKYKKKRNTKISKDEPPTCSAYEFIFQLL
jgi:hypothetical protein